VSDTAPLRGLLFLWGKWVPEKEMIASPVCWNCHGETAGLFCEHCQKIQPFPPSTDFFEVLGLPRKMRLDPKDLEKRFHDLSRRFHPDFYQKRGEAEREISLTNAAMVNNAYRTLRNPEARAEYLVRRIEGGNGEIPLQPPADLFEEILELQETLEEFKDFSGEDAERERLREKLVSARSGLNERSQKLFERLEKAFDAWDGSAREDRDARERLLKEMKEVLSHRAYLARIINDVNQALGKER
jgi:molecular chaperone HscB